MPTMMTPEARRAMALRLKEADDSLNAAIADLRRLEDHYLAIEDTFQAQLTATRWRELYEAKAALHAAAEYECGATEPPRRVLVTDLPAPRAACGEDSERFIPVPRTGDLDTSLAVRETCTACGRLPGSTPGCVCDER